MLKIIPVMMIIVLFSFSIATVRALGSENTLERMLVEKQKYPLWYVGKDVFSQNYVYHICDYSIKPTLNYATPCYQVQLGFIALLQEQNEKSWIVQAIFTSDDTHRNWFSILHISDDFATITSDGTSMNYVSSLSHTLFYLQKYANTHKPQLLKIGTSWGTVSEYVSPVPQLVVDRFATLDIGNTIIPVYQVGFEVSKYNVFYLQEKIPFPLESVLYDSNSPYANPRVLYQIKLLSISNMSKNTVAGQSPDMPQICSSSMLQEQTTPKTVQRTHFSNNTRLLNSENNITQNTLKNDIGSLDQNYTDEINFMPEDEILKTLKGIYGNFTLNTTR